MQTQFQKAACHVVGIFVIVVSAVFHPFAAFLAGKDVRLVGEFGDQMVKKVESTSNFHTAVNH